MAIDQISVFVENSVGRLAEVTAVLGDAGIDMRAMCIADTTDFGILRVIVSNPNRAIEILKAAGCVVSVTQVLAVSIPDTPGSLSRVIGILSDSGISVEYAYAFITRKKGNAYVIFRVENNEQAEEILAGNGVKTADTSELYEL
ncbi:MAG: ACT domain-containing protein [Synergistaceae bacterium]|jgi:hypothetical protein|nr:ACT domain-containing protein [Synergistaceae bacterium]